MPDKLRAFFLTPSLEPRPLPNLRQLVIVLLGNTVIAGLLWLTSARWTFASAWMCAQSTGLSICFICIATQYYTRDRLGWTPALLIAVLIGTPLGVLIPSALGFDQPLKEVLSHPMTGARYLAFGLLFSFVFSYYFRSRVRIVELEQARQAAELREAQGQKAALQAQLRLLQAQIEPHFLFNTLANLHSLIGRDDAAARAMLERLNDYLRASLAHSRSEAATLGDELAMLEAYLGIHAQRTGGRLRHTLEVDPALRTNVFPPMLLQPLVENAIVHGIEPKMGEGRVTIRAEEQSGFLRVSVDDDGLGLNGSAVGSAGSGVGLANVRERLAALYGSEARLELIEKASGGLVATLSIPLESANT